MDTSPSVLYPNSHGNPEMSILLYQGEATIRHPCWYAAADDAAAAAAATTDGDAAATDADTAAATAV